MDNKGFIDKAAQLRRDVLRMCINSGTGHVTSSMSCVEILTYLYYSGIFNVTKGPGDESRDRLILSKAQASPLLYSILADLGYYDKKELNLFAQEDGIFGVHLQDNVPGVETTAGALGHGLGIASGLAMGLKKNRKLNMVYCLMGDGELYEGSIWESLMFASHHNLNNLVGIIDRNYLCTTDFTENIIELEPLEERIESFGWKVIRIDGHCFDSIKSAFNNLRSRPSRKPTMIICNTVKGKGVPQMCFDPLGHGISPREKDIESISSEHGL